MSISKKQEPVALVTSNIAYETTDFLPELFGDDDAHLKRIESKLNVDIVSRGNLLAITGSQTDVRHAQLTLERLQELLVNGEEVTMAQINAQLRMTDTDEPAKSLKSRPQGDMGGGEYDSKVVAHHSNVSIKTMRKIIRPYSKRQAEYMLQLQQHDLAFALGPAGTGKTYIAVAQAVQCFMSGEVNRIILSRPAVEAGEKLGFLPGDLKEKIDPYLRPLYDALFEMMSPEKVMRHMENGEIEVAPLAFMRGRTLSNSFIILDEAQNSTATQMKMFLTRLGEGSKMVVTGDLSQVDLPRDIKSGLHDAIRKVGNLEGIATTKFDDKDVVRHDLAARIVKAYDQWESKKIKLQRERIDTVTNPTDDE